MRADLYRVRRSIWAITRATQLFHVPIPIAEIPLRCLKAEQRGTRNVGLDDIHEGLFVQESTAIGTDGP